MKKLTQNNLWNFLQDGTNDCFLGIEYLNKSKGMFLYTGSAYQYGIVSYDYMTFRPFDNILEIELKNIINEDIHTIFIFKSKRKLIKWFNKK